MKNFDYDVYDINEYDYYLPEHLIAQSPALKRDESKLLVINRKNESLEDKHFSDICDYLKPGDVLIRNNTKVIPARLFGVKKETNAQVELLLLHPIDGKKDTYEVLCGNARVIKEGTEITIGDNHDLIATCLKVKDEGIRIMKLTYEGILFEVLERIGRMPLPPYIKKQVSDNSRYQTVYAKIEGSAAAPTAGFHFTEQLLEKLKRQGVTIADVTLHVGLGTFRPVKVNNLKNHVMHSEEYFMNEETAQILNLAKKEGRRIIAIGTTSTRTLETIYAKYNEFKACHGQTDLFIYPGFDFKAIDGLITNFHLPKSTLLMLVSAFANKDLIMKAYEHAIKNDYRFFSFGDAMMIV